MELICLVYHSLHLQTHIRPFFFDYLVYGSADPIFQDLEKKKKKKNLKYFFFNFFFYNFFFLHIFSCRKILGNSIVKSSRK